MRREIHHQQPPAHRQRMRGLAQSAQGIIEIMQDLMHDYEIKTFAIHRQGIEIPLPQFDAMQPLGGQLRARHRQH